jgi:hypothetical protein
LIASLLPAAGPTVAVVVATFTRLGAQLALVRIPLLLAQEETFVWGVGVATIPRFLASLLLAVVARRCLAEVAVVDAHRMKVLAGRRCNQRLRTVGSGLPARQERPASRVLAVVRGARAAGRRAEADECPILMA